MQLSTKDMIIKSINRSNRKGEGDDLFSQLADEINSNAKRQASIAGPRQAMVNAQIQFAAQFTIRH
tara:strand:+ start:1567 stop:1764 length:198 start_codon:yes stop_codon:yes gene_type:complete